LAVTIERLVPLTIAKADPKKEAVKQSDSNIVNEQSDREMSESDQCDQCDRDRLDPQNTIGTPINTQMPQKSLGHSVTRSHSDIVNKESTGMELTINQAIQRAMQDNQGNNKGYFTLDDLVFVMQMLPNERWTDNEIEQTLHALLQEGKVQEMEPGKFKPANNNGGGEGEGGAG
jgi:hypothetical protein